MPATRREPPHMPAHPPTRGIVAYANTHKVSTPSGRFMVSALESVPGTVDPASTEFSREPLRIPHDENEIFAKALRGLIIRARDDIRGCLILAENKLVTQALSLSRDFVEIELLIVYFTIHPDEIPTWYNANQRKREKEYGPKKLRDEIMEKFPNMESGMKSDYRGHSILTHLNPRLLVHSTAHLPFTILDVSQHAARIAQRVAVFAIELDTSQRIEGIKRHVEELTRLNDQLLKVKNPIIHDVLKKDNPFKP